MSLRGTIATRAIPPHVRDRIEREGLTEAEARGALYALMMVEQLARVATPKFPAMAASGLTVPVDKALRDQARMAIALARATRLTLPLARSTHGMAAATPDKDAPRH